MHVEINGESVKFKPINIPYGRNSKYFIDSAKRYFLKVPHSNNQYNNELAALRILQKYDRYFPRLVFVGSNYLVTNYIDGKGISVSTRPANIIEQMKDIADMLEAEHIVHGDLHMSNIMIDIHEQVWLIDFGHSTITKPMGVQRDRLIQVGRSPVLRKERPIFIASNFRGYW